MTDRPTTYKVSIWNIAKHSDLLRAQRAGGRLRSSRACPL
jgi:hypothetical protein